MTAVCAHEPPTGPRSPPHRARFFDLWNDATADQKQILLALAAFAPDIRPGHTQLCALIGIHKSKIRPAIAYWLALKVLVLVSPGRPKNAAVYRIDSAQIAALLGSYG